MIPCGRCGRCVDIYMDSFLYQWSDILVSKENTCATNIYAADAVPSFNSQNCFEVHMRRRGGVFQLPSSGIP